MSDPVKNLELVQPTAHVTKQKKGDAHTQEAQEPVGGPVAYEQPTCNVGARMGMTKNLGNFESLRVEVSLFMPCYPHELDDVYKFTKEWVDSRIEEIMTEVNQEIGG